MTNNVIGYHLGNIVPAILSQYISFDSFQGPLLKFFGFQITCGFEGLLLPLLSTFWFEIFYWSSTFYHRAITLDCLTFLALSHGAKHLSFSFPHFLLHELRDQITPVAYESL